MTPSPLTDDEIHEALEAYVSSFDIDDEAFNELLDECDDIEEIFDRLLNM